MNNDTTVGRFLLAAAQDRNLSNASLGVLCKLLSRAHWNPTIDSVALICGTGRCAAKSAIDELIGAGYLERDTGVHNGRYRCLTSICVQS